MSPADAAGRDHRDEVAALDVAIEERRHHLPDGRRARRHHEVVVEQQDVDTPVRRVAVRAHLVRRRRRTAGGPHVERQADLGKGLEAPRLAILEDREVGGGQARCRRAVGVGDDDVDDDLVDRRAQGGRRDGRRLLRRERRDQDRGDNKRDGEPGHAGC
jgi:hypothetical protein